MHTQLTSRPFDQVIAAIQALDLDPIKFKLMDAVEGHGWSREYADRMELAYKRFLTLSVTHPEETLAPSKDVDRFWHGHILDTLKYAEDCEKVFGYFLHHFPYFGMRGAEDAANLAAAAEHTKRLYQQEFSNTPNKEAAWCAAAYKNEKPAWCAAAVEPEGAAWCAAAVKADDAAWCAAAVKNENPAWCAAAVKPEGGAWCAAAGKADESAWCAAAVKARDAAWCAATRPASNKLNTSVRPILSPVAGA